RAMPASEYASHKLCLPKRLTNCNAIRRPKPVFTKPLEIKKAMTMSQILLLPKPCTAFFISETPVITMTVKPSIDTAPIGIACVIQAMIDATKIANIYQASILSESRLKGVMSQISIPSTKGKMNVRYFIEFCILQFPYCYTGYLLQLSIYTYKKEM